MSVRVQLYDLASAAAAAALADLGGDVYHDPDFLALHAEMEGGTPKVAVAECGGGRLAVPLLVRGLPESVGAAVLEGRDSHTPYGYPGPLSDAATTPAAADLWQGLKKGLAEQGIISAFFRIHPFLCPAPMLAGARQAGLLVRHGDVVVSDLAAGPEAWWRETESGGRNRINRMRRDGWQVVFDWDYLDSFATLYWATMERRQARRFYFFPYSYFAALRDRLSDRCDLAVALSPDGEVGAASLFLHKGSLVHYHLTGVAAAFDRTAPTRLVVEAARQGYHQAGCTRLLLGGGNGGRADSLFKFKAGFSHQRAPAMTYRLVCDPQRYADLLRAWRQQTGAAFAPASDAFFPGYRNPAPAGS